MVHVKAPQGSQRCPREACGTLYDMVNNGVLCQPYHMLRSGHFADEMNLLPTMSLPHFRRLEYFPRSARGLIAIRGLHTTDLGGSIIQ